MASSVIDKALVLFAGLRLVAPVATVVVAVAGAGRRDAHLPVPTVELRRLLARRHGVTCNHIYIEKCPAINV